MSKILCLILGGLLGLASMGVSAATKAGNPSLGITITESGFTDMPAVSTYVRCYYTATLDLGIIGRKVPDTPVSYSWSVVTIQWAQDGKAWENITDKAYYYWVDGTQQNATLFLLMNDDGHYNVTVRVVANYPDGITKVFYRNTHFSNDQGG